MRLFCFLIAATSFAQPALQFEVASLRPSADKSGDPLRTVTRGGPGGSEPERLDYRNVPLRTLLMISQGRSNFRIDVPAWMANAEFDITAKLPAGATNEQFQKMLENLLVERFEIVAHHETRDVPGYDLVVGKNGAKFKESGADPGPQPRGPLAMDKDGKPILMPGRTMGVIGPNRIVLGRQPISALVNQLTNLLQKPIADKTGLTGKYDMVMDYSPEGLSGFAAMARPAPAADGPAPAPDGLPSIFSALQDQLGLKLETTKVPFDVFVVEKANRVPHDN